MWSSTPGIDEGRYNSLSYQSEDASQTYGGMPHNAGVIGRNGNGLRADAPAFGAYDSGTAQPQLAVSFRESTEFLR